MSYSYFAGRGRRSRDLARARIRYERLSRDNTGHQQAGCNVCGRPAAASTLDGKSVCIEHLPKIEIK
jgi:hypothetical protein